MKRKTEAIFKKIIQADNQPGTRGLVVRVGPFYKYRNIDVEIRRVYPRVRLDMVTTGGMLTDLRENFPHIREYFVHQRGSSLRLLLARLPLDEYDFIIVTGRSFFTNLLCCLRRPKRHLVVTTERRWYLVWRPPYREWPRNLGYLLFHPLRRSWRLCEIARRKSRLGLVLIRGIYLSLRLAGGWHREDGSLRPDSRREATGPKGERR